MQHLSTAFLIIALAIVVNERVVSAQNADADDDADLLAVETKNNALAVIEGPKNVSLAPITTNQPYPLKTNQSYLSNLYLLKANQTYPPEQGPPSKPPISPTPDKNYFLPQQFFSPGKKLQVPPVHVYTKEPLKLSNSVYKYPNILPTQQLNPFNHPTSNVNYPIKNFSHPLNNFNHPTKDFNHHASNLNYPPKNFIHPTNNLNYVANNFNPTNNFNLPPIHQTIQQPRPPYIYSAVTGKPTIINSPKFSLPVQTINGIRTEFVRPPKFSNTTTTTTVPTTTRRLLRTKRIWPKKILQKMNMTSENKSSTDDILKQNLRNTTDLTSSGSRVRVRYVRTEKPTISTTESTTRVYRRVTRTPRTNSTSTLKPIPQNDWVPIVPSHYPKKRPTRTRIRRRSDTYMDNQDDTSEQKNLLYFQPYSLVPMPAVYPTPTTAKNMVFFRKKKQHLHPYLYQSDNDVKPMNPYEYSSENNPKSILNPYAHASNHHPKSVLNPYTYDQNLKAVFNPQSYLSDYTTKPVVNPYEYESDHTPKPLDPLEYSSDYRQKPISNPHAFGAVQHPRSIFNPFAIQRPNQVLNPFLYPVLRQPKTIYPQAQISNTDLHPASSQTNPNVVTKIKHHHHHHHHRYVKTVEKPVNVPVKVEVPKPYPVEKPVAVPVPVEKIKIVDRPYPVPVEKKVPYPVPVKVPQPVPVKVVEKEYVPKPYPVFQQVPVLKQVEVKVPQPVPVQVEKKVPVAVRVEVPVEKRVPVPVEVEKRVPYPVPVRVLVPQPYTVEKKVPYPVEVKIKEPYEIIKHVPIKVPIPQPYPVKIPHPVRIEVEKRVPYPVKVEKKIPVPVEVIVPKRIEVERKIPVYIPKPYPVEKKIPYPVKVPYPVKIPVRVPVEVPVQVPVYIHHPFQIINDNNIMGSTPGYQSQVYLENQVVGDSQSENEVTGTPYSVSVHGDSGHNYISRSDTEPTTSSSQSP